MRLKQIRKANKRTQAQIADYLGIPLRTYQNYEREINDPDSNVLCKLADYYDVTLDYLLELSDVPNPTKVETVMLSSEEMELLTLFHQMNDSGKTELGNYATYLLTQDRFKKKEVSDHTDRLQGIA